MSARDEAALTESRRIEELALNASGGPHSLVYDGWLLGYRRDPSKRYRCINPFYASALALDAKIEHCIAFYAGIGLPTLFRLLPFSQPRELDSVLDRRGWAAFERTRVLRCSLADLGQPARPAAAVELVEPPAWEPHAAPLLNVDSEALPRFIARAANHPLPQLGALVRRQGEVIACGLLKIEAGHAGLFAIHTAEAWRGQGFARVVVAALLDEARRRGAGLAYLQVTAENAPALALYRRFGFIAAHDYWYRAREGEQH